VSPGRRDILGLLAAGLGTAALPRWARAADRAALDFDVRGFGAVGDGRTLDTPAVNAAIEAAAAAGGGVVRLRAGTYACHSIRMKSCVALVLEPGATILAAPVPGFDAAEPNTMWDGFQDFGHNHWHNSLIWGEGLHDIALLGPGLIWGRGLSRGEVAEQGLPAATENGVANKAIALKNCSNVLLRDFSVREGGHFGLLATGVDNLTIDNLKIDTNRDGMNIDCCRNVRIINCSVNSPWDDGICLKSSYALGEARPTENVTITNCYVTGDQQIGALLDGSHRRMPAMAEGGTAKPTGRIKLGTESNGGFRNITVSNCIFESCRGLAIETVDGGAVEDITFTGIAMRDIRNAPFFLRLGARLRGPAGTEAGTLRRVIIRDVTCAAPANTMPAIIAGIPGHPIEDISISDVYLVQQGGGTAADAAIIPPELESSYPEPSWFGTLPAQGLLLRHVRNVEVSHLEIASVTADARPFVWLGDVDGAEFFRLRLPTGTGAPAFALRGARNFRVTASVPIADAVRNATGHEVLR
jgi:polygalacturonase